MKTILVIDDEKDLAELISFNLAKEGYRVITALDGTSGLESARSHIPDLIILDLMLPGINGIEICKILKVNEKTARIPVVMLTAKGEEIDRVVGFEVGADDYMVKPFSNRELTPRKKPFSGVWNQRISILRIGRMPSMMTPGFRRRGRNSCHNRVQAAVNLAERQERLQPRRPLKRLGL
jgi:CheY-like chemotaxis protein